MLTISGSNVTHQQLLLQETEPSPENATIIVRGENLSNTYSFATVFLVWILTLIVFYIVWKIVNRKNKVWTIDETSSESKTGSKSEKPYKYLIRIRSGNCTVNFDNERAMIYIYFLDRTKGRLRELTLPPQWINKTSHPDPIQKDLRVCEFYWPQESPLDAFFYLQLSHSCRVPNSGITINDIDIRERWTSLMARINVQHSIKSLDKGMDKEQIYPVANFDDPMKDDYRTPVSKIRTGQFSIFMFLYSNLVLVLSLYIPYSPEETDTTSNAMINGAVAATIAYPMTLVIMLLFNQLRKKLHPFAGQEFYYFTGLCLVNTIYFSLTCGLLSAFEASRYNTNHTNNWSMGVGLAQFILLFIFTPMYFTYIKFCAKDRVKGKESESFKPRTVGGPNDRHDDLPPVPKSPSQFSIQSTGSNYYDQLMAGGNIPRVKSISQYGALLAAQEGPK